MIITLAILVTIAATLMICGAIIFGCASIAKAIKETML